MAMDPKTLTERLEAARARERAARAEAARLKREMAAADRRRETQRLCTLGRAWLALGEQDAAFRSRGREWLAEYISRPGDREVLTGTPWELPWVAGGDHE